MSSSNSILISEIQQLLECEIFESALQIAELECVSRYSDPNISASDRLAHLRIYCRCLNACKQYRRSLKAITDFVSRPVKQQLSRNELEDIARDISDIRWNLCEHDLCLAQLRQIPTARRTIKDIARMAKCASLIQNSDAADLYTELLKRQPNAIEAYTYLNTAADSTNDQIPYLPSSNNYHDVAGIAVAQSMIARLNYREAASQLQRLLQRHPRNGQMIAQQATCRYMLGETSKAKILYEKARRLDPSIFSEMDMYSSLLYSTAQDSYAVYRLGGDLLKIDQQRPEGWVAMAWYFLMIGHTQDALAIAWKAQTLSPNCAGAYYTEGAIQIASECPEEAADAFLKAHQLSRSALTYRGVVEAYALCGRYKEAFILAKEAAELMPKHAGSLAMVGAVLSHSPECFGKAVKLLIAALEIDNRCVDAISALVSLYVSNENYAEAIELIEKHLPANESDAMYTRYADVLTLANELPKAAVNYATALNINPKNEKAKIGLDRVDRLLHPRVSDEDEDEGAVGNLESDTDTSLRNDAGTMDDVTIDGFGGNDIDEESIYSSRLPSYDSDLASGGGFLDQATIDYDSDIPEDMAML